MRPQGLSEERRKFEVFEVALQSSVYPHLFSVRRWIVVDEQISIVLVYHKLCGNYRLLI